MRKGIVYFVAVSGLVFGCKNDGSGSVTLDLTNASRSADQQVTLNRCSGPNKLDAQQVAGLKSRNLLVTDSDADETAVLDALSALPRSLQDAYFDLGNRIEVTSRAKDLCADVHKRADGRSSGDLTEVGPNGPLIACYDRNGADPDPFKDTQTIYIDANPETIAFAVTRAAAYALANDFAYMKLVQGKVQAKAEFYSKAFGDIETKLAVAVLSDVNGQADAFAPLRDIVPTSLLTAPKDQIAALHAADTDHRVAREKALLAESMDSYYCSAETRSRMATSFPQAYALFDGTVAKGIDAMLPGSKKPASPAGLALDSYDYGYSCGLLGFICDQGYDDYYDDGSYDYGYESCWNGWLFNNCD